MLQTLQNLQGNTYPYPYIYPQPAQMADLIQPLQSRIHNVKPWHDHASRDYKPVAHPSFLEGMDTDQMFKIFKFGTWARKMVSTNKFKTLSDVIRGELQIFENGGFPLREDFQVQPLYVCHRR